MANRTKITAEEIKNTIEALSNGTGVDVETLRRVRNKLRRDARDDQVAGDILRKYKHLFRIKPKPSVDYNELQSLL